MKRFPHSLRVKDFRQQGEVFRVRAIVAFIVILMCLGGLITRFVFLQITHHDEFTAKSEANRISTRGISPSRGLIYDRSGVLVADNTAAFRLEVVPEHVNMDALFAELGDVVAISDDDVTRFNAARRNKKPFESIPLRLKLSDDEIAHFSINRWRFPAVDIVPYLTRSYPLGATFAHVVGYVGRIDINEAAKLDENLYTGTTHIGKTGIERFYEDDLHGTPGYERIEVNADRRQIGDPIERVAPTPGKNLYLSVDARLQRVAEEAFTGRSGAAVAIDPRTGEVLALVSVPSFDANMFVNGISQIDYARLMGDPAKPLLNRAIAGGFLPGSTMKPYVGVAGLELGLRKPSDTVVSTGEFHIPGQERGYRDDFPAGSVNMSTAITESVNTYFYSLALDMGIDRFSDFLGRFGFGARTGVDLTGEGIGVLPSREWKRATQNKAWYPGETVIAGIGQGAWVVTPIQLATALSTIAAKGERRQPRLLHATQNGLNETPQTVPPPLPLGSIFHNAATWPTIEQGMVGVINSPGGTARGIGDAFPYVIAGKTGTAERFSRTDETWTSIATSSADRHQVLFECFAPADDARVAVVVALEAGHSGASDAAPIARKILDGWLKYVDDSRPVAGTQ